MLLMLLTGCSGSKLSVASDDTFFEPLKALPRVVETRPQPPTKAPTQSSVAEDIDSLQRSQRDQERRLAALVAQLQLLESRNRELPSDSARRASQPSVSSSERGRRVAPSVVSEISEAERLYNAREYRQTIKRCEDLLKGEAGGVDERCYYLLGASYYRLKKFDLASVYLKKALTVEGSTQKAESYFMLGLTYKQLGMAGRARTMYEAALKESPRDDLKQSLRKELRRLAKTR